MGSVIINVRLYDSQDELKSGPRNMINPNTFSDWELRCTQDRNVGYHEKCMNGGDTGVFKKNSESSSTRPHENSVYIEKATYQMNSGSAGVYGW